MSAQKCPICGKPTDEKHRPFCSKRCSQRDLGKWLDETYSIPAADAPDDEEERDTPTPADKETYH